jgi:hypothetical protein
MGNYLVTFELRSDASYNQRYRSLTEQLQSAPTLLCWDQSTSFCALSSPETIGELADRLRTGSRINGETDLLLVIDPAASHCVALGPIRFEPLLSSRFSTYERR